VLRAFRHRDGRVDGQAKSGAEARGTLFRMKRIRPHDGLAAALKAMRETGIGIVEFKNPVEHIDVHKMWVGVRRRYESFGRHVGFDKTKSIGFDLGDGLFTLRKVVQSHFKSHVALLSTMAV
jgi:hypothetical protein